MDKDDIYDRLENELLKQRVLFIEGDFDEDSINILKRELMYCMTHKPKTPVTLYISSYGGDPYDLLSIYGLLELKQFELTTIAMGKCMSAGADLLMLGDKRIGLPGAKIMMHEIAWESSYAKLHDQEIEIKESRKLQEFFDNIIKEKTKIKNISEFMKIDHYLDIDEAYKLGILTEKPKNKKRKKDN